MRMTLQENHLVTADEHGTLEIWDIRTENGFRGLQGEMDSVNDAIDSRDIVIMSQDYKGRVIVWSIQAVLDGTRAKLVSLTDPNFDPHIVAPVTVGTNFIVVTSWDCDVNWCNGFSVVNYCFPDIIHFIVYVNSVPKKLINKSSILVLWMRTVSNI